MLATEDPNESGDRMNGGGINDWETLKRQNKQDFEVCFVLFCFMSASQTKVKRERISIMIYVQDGDF